MTEQSPEGSAAAFSKLVQAQEYGLGDPDSTENVSPTSVDDYSELNARHETGALASIDGKDTHADPLSVDIETRLNEGVPHARLADIDDVPEGVDRSENAALHHGDDAEKES